MPVGQVGAVGAHDGDVGVQRREVLERRRRAVGPGAALEEPRLDLGRARELDLTVGTVAEPPPHVPRQRGRLHHVHRRTAAVRLAHGRRGRPTPPGASGPSPTCGSRALRPAGRRSAGMAIASQSSSLRTRPGCRRSTRIPVPPPSDSPRITTSSSPRWSSIATTSPGRGQEPAVLEPSWARRWCRGPAGRRPTTRWSDVSARASGSNTPAQKPFGCSSTSGGPSPPQSSAPMVKPSCSTDHRCGSSGALVIGGTLPNPAPGSDWRSLRARWVSCRACRPQQEAACAVSSARPRSSW